MARTSITIYTALERALVATAAMAGIVIVPSNWSKTDYKRLFLNIFADSQSVQEQSYDSFTQDVENIASVLAPQTYQWIQDKMLNLFEFDAISVPIVQLNTTVIDGQMTLVPYYPNPNPNFRIIKYCVAIPGGFGSTLIKIAGDSSGSPVPITGSALSAAITFANIIFTPGLYYNVISLAADRLFMQLDVYYNGLYSAVIEANVIAALRSYLLGKSTINFNGQILLTEIELAVKGVTGVNDVVLINVQARSDVQTVGTGVNLILNSKELIRNYQTVAGHIIPEDTSGGNWRLTDFRVGASGLKNLNLIAQ